MATDPFLVDVADLARAGASRRERLVVPVDWALEFSRVDSSVPLVADLVLRSVPGGLVVVGEVEVVVEHTCVACLSTFTARMSIDVAAMFEAEPDEETYPLVGDDVDLEQMLRDEVMLALPLVPRCDGEHGRVVTTPATDLNTDLPDSPFAALRDMIEVAESDPGSEEAR